MPGTRHIRHATETLRAAGWLTAPGSCRLSDGHAGTLIVTFTYADIFRRLESVKLRQGDAKGSGGPAGERNGRFSTGSTRARPRRAVGTCEKRSGRLKPWFKRPARPVRIDLRHSSSRRLRERCPLPPGNFANLNDNENHLRATSGPPDRQPWRGSGSFPLYPPLGLNYWKGFGDGPFTALRASSPVVHQRRRRTVCVSAPSRACR